MEKTLSLFPLDALRHIPSRVFSDNLVPPNIMTNLFSLVADLHDIEGQDKDRSKAEADFFRNEIGRCRSDTIDELGVELERLKAELCGLLASIFWELQRTPAKQKKLREQQSEPNARWGQLGSGILSFSIRSVELEKCLNVKKIGPLRYATLCKAYSF